MNEVVMFSSICGINPEFDAAKALGLVLRVVCTWVEVLMHVRAISSSRDYLEVAVGDEYFTVLEFENEEFRDSAALLNPDNDTVAVLSHQQK